MRQLLARFIKPSSTNGDVLTTVSGKTTWAAAAASGGGSGNVPAGGASGQVLTKLSAADYDTGWQTPSGGTGGGGAAISVVWSAGGAGLPSFTPAGIAAGDIGLLVMVNDGTLSAPPAGWTTLYNGSSGTGYYGSGALIAGHRVTAADVGAAVSGGTIGAGHVADTCFAVLYARGPSSMTALTKSDTARGNTSLPGYLLGTGHAVLTILAGTNVPGINPLPAFPAAYAGTVQGENGYCSVELGLANQDTPSATLTTSDFDHSVYALSLA